ncbi:MAG TPA: hypothetical protein VEP67_08880 [Thiobacillaceae bacterium]|nr:hypothetical protein [Thiobacillaceae bacterium]
MLHKFGAWYLAALAAKCDRCDCRIPAGNFARRQAGVINFILPALVQLLLGVTVTQLRKKSTVRRQPRPHRLEA